MQCENRKPESTSSNGKGLSGFSIQLGFNSNKRGINE